MNMGVVGPLPEGGKLLGDPGSALASVIDDCTRR